MYIPFVTEFLTKFIKKALSVFRDTGLSENLAFVFENACIESFNDRQERRKPGRRCKIERHTERKNAEIETAYIAPRLTEIAQNWI